MSDAGGTRYDLSVQHTIKALVREAKALEKEIEDRLDDWTMSFACLMILEADAVDHKHETEKSANQYVTIQHMRNELQEKKKKIKNLLKTSTVSTDEQINQSMRDERRTPDKAGECGPDAEGEADAEGEPDGEPDTGRTG